MIVLVLLLEACAFIFLLIALDRKTNLEQKEEEIKSLQKLVSAYEKRCKTADELILLHERHIKSLEAYIEDPLAWRMNNAK